MARTLPFQHRHKRFEIRIADDGALELYLDGCLRKRREWSGREPQYVWTNVELEWEEHHYVEARYWASRSSSIASRRPRPARGRRAAVPTARLRAVSSADGRITCRSGGVFLRCAGN